MVNPFKRDDSDPRDAKIPVQFSKGQGSAVLRVGSIKGVSRPDPAGDVLEISIEGYMILYVQNEPHLYGDILSALLDCQIYEQKRANEAVKAIR